MLLSTGVSRSNDWPQWLGEKRDSVWRETGILEKFPAGGPPVRWRVPVGGGYSGPAVAEGRVFLTDRQLTPGAANAKDPFQRGEITGSERVLCFEERSGKILWQHGYSCPYTVSYPAGPRATPTVDGDRVYTLGAEGDLFCFVAASGKVLWSRDLKKDYQIQAPLWGFAGHPLVDGDKLLCLVGGEGSVAVAFNKMNGKELWRALSSKEPGYCPPTIIEAGGKRQLILWHGESINSLDPETGKVYWTEPWKLNFALSIPTPRQSGNLLFLTAFYNGSHLLRLSADKPEAELIWKSRKTSEKDTEKLHSIMSSPLIEEGYIYGVCSYGQLRCLKLSDGERVWETFQATTGDKPERWANAFLIKQGSRFFLANEKGDLIIANLSPKGYEELSRCHLVDPTGDATGRPIVWSHPAFANRCVYARNDRELVCLDLRAP